MAAESPRTVSQAFRPRARLLQILGDQLIGSSRLAVFELVKNSYDADASEVTVSIRGLNGPSPSIVVEDNGYGMSFETIRDIWLVPADDHRERERASNVRSPKFRRLPLGEKGVGRFAVHKLGDRIELVTRAADLSECVVNIDWRDMVRSRLLDEALVTVTERTPEVFRGPNTGTRVIIRSLRETNWTRRDIRDLWRQVTSIASPFRTRRDKFDVTLDVPDRAAWLKDMPDVRELMRRAPWNFSFSFTGSKFEYSYAFHGVPGIPVAPRTEAKTEPLQIWSEQEPDDLDPMQGSRRRKIERVVADASTIEGIGTVKGRLYVFDRDREVLSRYAERRLIERFLNQNGGIRVYRDDIRVYNYGERDDDWLGLDLRRVNTPTRNISRNIVVGVIDLDLDKSVQLKEKTNREGFVANSAYGRLRQIVLGALSALEAERQIDKRKLRLATGKPTGAIQGITSPIEQLRLLARQHGVLGLLEPSIRRIEEDYATLRENFLRSGLSNSSLAVVLHEIEKGVSILHKTILAGGAVEQLRLQSGQLQAVLENSTRLLRKSEKEVNSLRDLVVRIRDLLLVRFRIHEIQLLCPPLEPDGPDAKAVFAFNLALGAVSNLIDNAIYWLRVARPDGATGADVRRIFLSVIPEWPGGPAVIVSDNGTGFQDPPDQLVEPFFSRKPDGMGLGLYYANMVMQLNDGRMEFPDPGDIDLPDGFDGATVVLVFKGT